MKLSQAVTTIRNPRIDVKKFLASVERKANVERPHLEEDKLTASTIIDKTARLEMSPIPQGLNKLGIFDVDGLGQISYNISVIESGLHDHEVLLNVTAPEVIKDAVSSQATANFKLNGLQPVTKKVPASDVTKGMVDQYSYRAKNLFNTDHPIEITCFNQRVLDTKDIFNPKPLEFSTTMSSYEDFTMDGMVIGSTDYCLNFDYDSHIERIRRELEGSLSHAERERLSGILKGDENRKENQKKVRESTYCLQLQLFRSLVFLAMKDAGFEGIDLQTEKK